MVVQLGEHSGKSYDNQTGVTETKIKGTGMWTRMMTGKIKDNEDDRRTDSNRMQIAWRSSRMGIGGG